MKKLKLDFSLLGTSEVLSRDQLKGILGGDYNGLAAGTVVCGGTCRQDPGATCTNQKVSGREYCMCGPVSNYYYC